MPSRRKKVFLFFLCILLAGRIAPPSLLTAAAGTASCQERATPEKKATLLNLLGLIPSPRSIDFVQEKTSYQLHPLVTEQRHPKTWNLSDRIADDITAGYRMLFAVDEDIAVRLGAFDREVQVLERAVLAVEEAILSGQKIYIFGCRETGRWAKWLEGSLWRPFWKNLQARDKIWEKVGQGVGDAIENRLIAEMPGGDASLVFPLKGWQDLMITGRIQFEERGIEPGDVVFCLSASGETPAVIGTIFEALDRWTRRYPYDAEKLQKKLFFFLNNPRDVLLTFDRCRVLLEEPGIVKIDCTTGPQALAGLTQMQASTVDAFLLAHILQAALDRSLRRFLSNKDMTRLGFGRPVVLAEKIREFPDILRSVTKIVPALSKMTASAEKTCREGRRVSYLASKGAGTVFNVCTEEGPAFHTEPLDNAGTEPKRSRIQVWVPQNNRDDAWRTILGRPFRTLSPAFYEKRFEQGGADPGLLRTAKESLEIAGEGQELLYDFSFSDQNGRTRATEKGNLGILVVVSPEEALLTDKDSYFSAFASQFLQKGNPLAIVLITEKSGREINKIVREIPGFDPEGKDILAVLSMEREEDALAINRLIALKILLNAHSASVMARTGKIVGNTVPVVDTTDLKSIDRATALVLSHVNDILKKPEWVKRHGIQKPISYGESNAVLFDTIHFMEGSGIETEPGSLVALSIIRILESLRLNRAFSLDEATTIVREVGLQKYLKNVTTQSQ